MEIAKVYQFGDATHSLVSFLSDSSDERRKELPEHLRARVHRYRLHEGLLLYSTDEQDEQRIVVPDNDDLKCRITFEYHDAPTSGHPGREKTYVSLARDFYWANQYKWVRKYVRACEVCQRVKPAPSSQAPLRSLPVPTECWKSISMDFVFGLPADSSRKTGVLVFVDRFSKMVHLTAVSANITAAETARVFVDTIFRLHGMPDEIISDRDPRFTARFWSETFSILGVQLKMSTADHLDTDGQTGRVNRVLGDMLRSYAHAFEQWSDCLSLTEFAINISVHASTGHTPFYVNAMRHPRLPAIIGGVPSLSGGGTRSSKPIRVDRDASHIAQIAAAAVCDQSQAQDGALTAVTAVNDFVLQRHAVIRFVKDSIADAVDRQKQNADGKGRKNLNEFQIGDLVLLSTTNLPKHAITNYASSKLVPKFVGPFAVQRVQGNAYTLNIPSAMRLHPTFYVGRLKPCHSLHGDDERRRDGSGDDPDRRADPCSRPATCRNGSEESTDSSASHDSPRGGRQPNVRVPEAGTRDARSHRASPRRTVQQHSVGQQVFPPPPPPVVDSSGNKRWIVERLLDHRDRQLGRIERTEYLVLWLGCPSSFDSWETKLQLEQAVPDLVRAYENRSLAVRSHQSDRVARSN